MWLGGGSPGKWSEHDLLLSLALQDYEDHLCPGCGQPKDVAWVDHEHAPGYFGRESIDCRGCAALAGDSKEKAKPGEKHYVVFEVPPDDVG